ncbi:MAG: hypothetical protein HUK40_23715 [Desulfobacter sp.]|nr:hypothetical protein [Desulfobacter sp.]
MNTKIKKINNQDFEILEHGETPGFRTAFHIIFGVALAYFICIFTRVH